MRFLRNIRIFLVFLIYLYNLIDFNYVTASSYNQKPSIKTYVSTFNKIISNNPVFRLISNSYSFFYWLPRRNIPYDIPWTFFRNDTAQLIAWYQIPHNLPPYRYLGRDVPSDFFCFGLPGNTLPLGNWDPWFLSQVSPSVVRKYRESEIKHSRLAMLGCIGCVVQENFHPIHPDIGGLAVTHMTQLLHSDVENNLLSRLFSEFGYTIDIPSMDYYLVILGLFSMEIFGLRRNWMRWKRNEYNHPFDVNIGIGNLKDTYQNGDYGFDPFHLYPVEEQERRDWMERELNHGRLAMIAFIGILYQEYVLGKPIFTQDFDSVNFSITTSYIDEWINSLFKLSSSILSLWSQNRILDIDTK